MKHHSENKCPETCKIAAYLDGGLKEDERRSIEEHAAGCDECTEVIAAAAGTVHPVEATPDLRRRAFGRNDRPTTGRRRPVSGVRRRVRKPTNRTAGPVALIGALAAAVVLAVVAIGLLGPEDNAGRSTTRAERPREKNLEPVRVAEVPEPRLPVREPSRPAGKTEVSGFVEESPEPPVEPVPELPITENAGYELPEPAPETPSEINTGQPETARVNVNVDVEPADEDWYKEETRRPVARIAGLERNAYYRRKNGARWYKAREGTPLQPGDEINSRFGKARLVMTDGTILCLNTKTSGTLFGDRLMVGRGEVFCDIRKPGSAFRIISEAGTVKHLGTEYLVRVSASGTTVVVTEGSVELTNDKGKVTVPAGHKSQARKDYGPSAPSRADTVRETAWTRALLRGVEEKEDETGMAALSFTLVNADTDQPIAGLNPIPEGAVIVLSMLPTRHLNVRVNCRPEVVGSMHMEISGVEGVVDTRNGEVVKEHIEQAIPYTLSDGKGDYHPFAFPPGNYVLKATPYSERGAGGEAGKPLTVRFTVLETPAP